MGADCLLAQFRSQQFAQGKSETSPSPHIPSLKWGHEKEDITRSEYRSRMQSHTNFKVANCGLVIHPEHPLLGCKPWWVWLLWRGLGGDQMPIRVQRCWSSTSRIKTSPCSLVLMGMYIISHTHPHYYHVQGKLATTGRAHCDYACWTPKGLFIERVYYVWQWVFPIPATKAGYIICPVEPTSRTSDPQTKKEYRRSWGLPWLDLLFLPP